MTLVLVHSSGATPAVWDRVREHLTGIPVFAPPLPGRDGVQWPPGDPDRSIAAYGRALVAAMDREGIEEATIAGHSLGGAVALHCAMTQPGRVAGLGLVCTGARLRVLPSVLDALADGARDAIERYVALWCTPKTSDRDRIALRRMVERVGTAQAHCDLAACDGFDVMDRLSEVRCRTQVIGASDDIATPPKYARYLAEHIAGARCLIEPDAGHALPLERPESVAGELAVLWAATAPRATAGREERIVPGPGGPDSYRS